MKSKIYTLLIILCLVLSNTMTINASNYNLDENQTEIAELISKICTERWEESGVLPSVCIAQAYLESHIVKHYYQNNVWGLHGGYKSYNTIEDGINAYIDCINNGYYDNALWHTDPTYVINAIYDGGYAETSKSKYVSNVLWIIKEFKLTDYDNEILKNCNMKTSNSFKTWKCIKE